MTKKKAVPAVVVGLRKAKWLGFINVYLSKEEKASIKANLLSYPMAIDFLSGCAEDGYKVSMSHSERGKFFSVTLFGQYEGKPNAGFAMSLKHADMLTAITALEHCKAEAEPSGDWSDRFTSSAGNDW